MKSWLLIGLTLPFSFQIGAFHVGSSGCDCDGAKAHCDAAAAIAYASFVVEKKPEPTPPAPVEDSEGPFRPAPEAMPGAVPDVSPVPDVQPDASVPKSDAVHPADLDACLHDFRTWTDSTGKHQKVARFTHLAEDFQTVHLRLQDEDKAVKIELSRLSEADQAFLRSHLDELKE